MTTMIGRVTQERYKQLVADGLEQLAVQGRTQLMLGDHALEIEPMNPRGGSHAGPGEEPFGVRQPLAQYAEDLDMPLTTLLDNRWVASRWPKERRQHGVSYVVHKALAGIADEGVRFAKILDPPWHEKSQTRRWTQDAAKREAGQRVNRPTTVQEKVNKVHDLLEDEKGPGSDRSVAPAAGRIRGCRGPDRHAPGQPGAGRPVSPHRPAAAGGRAPAGQAGHRAGAGTGAPQPGVRRPGRGLRHVRGHGWPDRADLARARLHRGGARAGARQPGARAGRDRMDRPGDRHR
ncbi:hypothetical protein E1295_00480 [Nonomuraea mesophila]|uniref:Uncharacterized protein n=1 Tax=Nonomuraea mesophila TaxID=2530382 RepID=A0A4R5FXS9_9ACTN|nr:hypothetical protein E1295_00480 [Nonomuraea mesophila]